MIISYPITTSDSVCDMTGHGPRSAGARPNFSRTAWPRPYVLFLFSILLLTLTGCRGATSLATVSSEDEAIEILNVLHENGIEARKEETGEEGAKQWRILLQESWFSGST